MIELLAAYSIKDILTFIVIIALAIKGVVSFWSWAKDKIVTVFRNSATERLNQHENQINSLSTNQQQIKNDLAAINEKIDLLIKSDKDDIKAYITKEHHKYCYEKHWIDDYTLDCIEKRYAHYKAEGGNSFIADLMREIKELPKRPPQE